MDNIQNEKAKRNDEGIINVMNEKNIQTEEENYYSQENDLIEEYTNNNDTDNTTTANDDLIFNDDSISDYDEQEINSLEEDTEYKESRTNNIKKLTLLIVIVILLISIFMFVQNGKRIQENNLHQDQKMVFNEEEDTAKLAEEYYNKANDGKESKEIEKNNSTNDKIAKVVVYDEKAEQEKMKDPDFAKQESFAKRNNPFVPSQILEKSNAVVGSYELVEPDIPEQDLEEVTNLTQTTVSGILYDREMPAAIINLSGKDQLVRKGDRINGYLITNITQDKVIVKYGTNIYRVSVGQAIGDEGIHFNEAATNNLQNRFGGKYTRGQKVIKMNSNN